MATRSLRPVLMASRNRGRLTRALPQHQVHEPFVAVIHEQLELYPERTVKKCGNERPETHRRGTVFGVRILQTVTKILRSLIRIEQRPLH
jgi:hypothetical protein